MPAHVFCEDCQCEVLDCEHLSHERKMTEIKEIDAGWENDLAYLESRIYELWLIVNAEDLGRPIPSREESSRASDELDRLLEKQHQLTRRPTCDCHRCREHGWWVPTATKPKRKFSLEDFIASGSDDWMSCSEPFTALKALSILSGNPDPEGSPHGLCLCDYCMAAPDRDDRHFFVVDGCGAIVVRAHELADFLRAYPESRVVR